MRAVIAGIAVAATVLLLASTGRFAPSEPVRRLIGGAERTGTGTSIAWTRLLVERAGRTGTEDPGAWLRGWGLVAGGVVASALVVPGLRVLAPLAIVAPIVDVVVRRERHRRARSRRLPEVLDAVAASLRAGGSVPDGLATAARTPGPFRDDLTAIQRRLRNGATLSEALAGWEAGASPDISFTVSALSLAAEVGGAAARAVDGAAASLRERLATAEERRALATQGQASAALLTIAPLAFTVLVTAADPEASRFLLTTPIGLGCLLGGIGLDAAGAWWMFRLTRSDR